MEVEWDPNKAAINRRKHGVNFSDAEAVLFDPNALSFEDITDRRNRVRLISARSATRSERKQYESGI